MSYRWQDGLIRGKRGGISSKNTKSDWASYHQRSEKSEFQSAQEALRHMREEPEKRARQKLIRERTEPKKFSSKLIEPTPPKDYKGDAAKASLFYKRKEKRLYFSIKGVGEFHPKIGCPIVLVLGGEEYCCEITKYGDDGLEVRICVTNEKRFFPFTYEPTLFWGLLKSPVECIICKVPLQLFE